MTGAIAHVAVVLPEVFYHFPLNFTYPFRICICSKHLLSAFWVFRQFVNPDWGSPPLQKMCLLISNCNASTPRKRGLHFFYQNLTAAAGALALAFAVERAILISAVLLSSQSFSSFCLCSSSAQVLVHIFSVQLLRTLFFIMCIQVVISPTWNTLVV